MFAQWFPDTLDFSRLNIVRRHRFLNNIFEDAVQSLSRKPEDTSDPNRILFTRSEAGFRRYEGRIIRHVYVRQFGFERPFTDTTSRILYFGTRLLNKAHIKTREWVIRNNLFFKERSPLNPFELADNERFLRTLPYIQDARIMVKPIRHNPDSVDILVITKDLFSLKGVIDLSSVNSVRVRAAEENFLGMAHSVQTTIHLDRRRSPVGGLAAVYGIHNLGGYFLNVEAGYTNINSGRSAGTEEEQSLFVRAERPLTSPYALVAGSTELSINKSLNVYGKPDSGYFNYQYTIADWWLGYNVTVARHPVQLKSEQARQGMFVSARYSGVFFSKIPSTYAMVFDPIYNDRKMLLLQCSFFRQVFYKLNYIYGFGTTEDMPNGYNLSVTAGWHQQRGVNRPYGGLHADQYLVTPGGGFLRAGLRLGAFVRRGSIEDAAVLAAVHFYTRIYQYRGAFLRHFVKVSYAQIDKRTTLPPLLLNNPFGISEFSADSVTGDKRISMYGESVLYTTPKILGFRMAPFAYAEGAIIVRAQQSLQETGILGAVGGGLRVRNENLVFGTLEARAIFFPRTVGDMAHFKVTFITDLRFRYQTRIVSAPDIIQLNSDVVD